MKAIGSNLDGLRPAGPDDGRLVKDSRQSLSVGIEEDVISDGLTNFPGQIDGPASRFIRRRGGRGAA